MAFDATRKDWIRRAAPSSRVERIEAYFGGHGYDMHRHDTYAIGRTLAGVQSFHYRRGMQHSLPGGTIVLHPDEAHDGQAGTDAGFHYRMIYVEPALIQQILGGRPLPFIHASLDQPILLDDLARAAGTDRWSLSRDFRALFGTSPYRYVMLRRLDLARRLIAVGTPLAQAAADAGFTDQSHLTRRHVQAYGMAPDRWRRMLNG